MKKVIFIIVAITIIVGIVLTVIMGLNVDIMYKNHEQLKVYVGKEIDIKDINRIVKEVFGKQKVKVIGIEAFNDAVEINTESVSNEQLESLKQKISEKYDLGETMDTIEQSSIPNLRLRDLIKPYIIPTLISTLLIFAFMAVRYKDIGSVKVVVRRMCNTCCCRIIFIKYYCNNKISC